MQIPEMEEEWYLLRQIRVLQQYGKRSRSLVDSLFYSNPLKFAKKTEKENKNIGSVKANARETENKNFECT